MLITAPRISSFAALQVKDLDREEGRLVYHGNEIKRAGAGALDDATLREFVEYVGDRKDGPLFLSPQGSRLDRYRSLDRWRPAFSLAVVDMQWPDSEPRDLRLACQVSYALTSGSVRVVMGGPLTGKHRPGRAKLAERRALEARVAALADEMRSKWEERMRGIDQHCLRMTHRTWALGAGVPEVLIDRQLGHSSPAGRAHYTDMGFLTLDARRSADAVRKILDHAEAECREVLATGDSVLGVPEQKGRLGIA